jgi:site-specific recombinase XerD
MTEPESLPLPGIEPAQPSAKRSRGRPGAGSGWRSKSLVDRPARYGDGSASAPAQMELAPPDPVRDLSRLLSVDERMHRDRVLSTAGPLRRAMLHVEASAAMSDDLAAEAWRWLTALQIVQGLASATTCTRYVDTLRKFAAWCGEQGVDYRSAAVTDLDEWMKSLFIRLRHRASWRTTQMQALKSFYDWRYRALGALNCAAGLRAPKRVTRAPRKYSTADLQRLFAAIKDTAVPAVAMRDRVLMLFFLCTGARREEAATLRLDQVELGHKSGQVRFFGKGAKERTVGIEGPIVDELRQWILLRDQIPHPLGDTVFFSTHPSYFGEPLTTNGVEHMVRRYATRAKLGDWGVHRFRVTYATGLYDDGADIERIRIALGHESIETTRQYLAVSDKQTATRLNPARQYHALGEPPKGLPLWAQKKLDKQRGGAA